MNRILKAITAAIAGCLCLVAGLAPLKAEPVKIRLGYGIIPGVISPLLFQKPEILKHYGKSYTVESTYIRATSIALQGMASGDVDLSYLSFTALASAIINGGLDMKVIADISSWGSRGHQGPEMVVKTDAGINSIADLKGKILAVTAKGTGFHYALVANLRKAGLKPSDYTIVEIGIAAMDAALREDRVNLITTVPPFLYLSEKKGGVKRLFKPEDAMGDVQSLVLVGSSAFLKKNPEAVKDFLEDYVIALRWFLDPKNHEEAVKITAEFTKRPPAVYESFAFTKKDFYRSPTATPDIKALQNNIDLMHELDVIKQKVDVKPYVDLSYLDAAKKRLGLQ
ncbi:MAG: ABC transporter substrate-binding protein [Deltaproteobacteria bacterium]|nr:ABC transporter substrate-binding protein [Deltaproteobacteria bacterium]